MVDDSFNHSYNVAVRNSAWHAQVFRSTPGRWVLYCYRYVSIPHAIRRSDGLAIRQALRQKSLRLLAVIESNTMLELRTSKVTKPVYRRRRMAPSFLARTD